MDNEIILGSLSSDLKRVGLGFYRNSEQMANRFLKEALKRKNEINKNDLPQYMVVLLGKIKKEISPDEALMYSTLIQNYVTSSGTRF